jgi:hypothetical protein
LDESATVPVVSFGSVYLMPQLVATGFLGSDSRPLEIDAYLTEWPSWGGNSGSPVFSYSLGATDDRPLSLMGVVHSHVNVEPEAEAGLAAIESGMIAMDFGLAAVVPAERVGELLSTGDTVRQRQEAIDALVVGELLRDREETLEQLAGVGRGGEQGCAPASPRWSRAPSEALGDALKW